MGNELKRDKDGRLICPKCSKPIDCITQAHYEHLEWDENLKKYCKIEWPGDYQNPICGECNEYLDTKYTQLFDEQNKGDNGVNRLKNVISKAVDEIEKYNRKDNVQIATVWDILRKAEREWRE